MRALSQRWWAVYGLDITSQHDCRSMISHTHTRVCVSLGNLTTNCCKKTGRQTDRRTDGHKQVAGKLIEVKADRQVDQQQLRRKMTKETDRSSQTEWEIVCVCAYLNTLNKQPIMEANEQIHSRANAPIRIHTR